MIKNSKGIITLSLALMLVFSPTLSYAKENDNKGNKERKNVSAQVEIEGEKRSCMKAFGHLIAPGYIKNKGEVKFFSDCFVPFGIMKKLNRQATSTPDTTSPMISNLSVKTGRTEAVITWRTSEKADSQLFWSTTTPVSIGSNSTASSTLENLTRDHRFVIKNLSASTTYYFIARSEDSSGNATSSVQSSFTTKGSSADTTAPSISNIAVLSGTTTASVSWKTSENASSKVYYSTTSPLIISASSTSFVANGALKKDHNLSLSGLTASSTYYLVVESADQSGNKSTSATFNLITK